VEEEMWTLETGEERIGRGGGVEGLEIWDAQMRRVGCGKRRGGHWDEGRRGLQEGCAGRGDAFGERRRLGVGMPDLGELLRKGEVGGDLRRRGGTRRRIGGFEEGRVQMWRAG
jgi:hypothetical protein